MSVKILTTVLALAIVAMPAMAPAGQPEVTLRQLQPEARAAVSDVALALLLSDPWAASELSIVLPASFTRLDGIEADPFAAR